MIHRIEKMIVECPPAVRRKIAIHMLIWSMLLMVANVVLYLVDVVGEGDLILITMILSWLAITITAADLVATTDVRDAEEAGIAAEETSAVTISG